MMPLTRNLVGNCPGGFCNIIINFSEIIVVILLLDCFFFLVTLLPCLFSWKTSKPDSKNRIFFAALASLTFYLWLTLLAINSLYCFGFLAHLGPCGNLTSSSLQHKDFKLVHEPPIHLEAGDIHVDDKEDLFLNLTSEADVLVDQCNKETENSLNNITLMNIIIVLVLLVTIGANINEVLNARALYHCETFCRTEDLQRFLSSLTIKRPEVGHLVKCFHTSKSADTKTNTVHKVVTYSTVENFQFQTWKDFSDLRLIEPSKEYPVIEVEISLNFFPGDHSTADLYKLFVQTLTKDNSGKDLRISIDDYFHIEDQREWTFFIGNQDFIVPWWEKNPARIPLSCILLLGWPFRFTYKGQVAKHKLEVKKAVFCEIAAQDEGVSLSATPGSSTDGAGTNSKVDIEVEASDSEDRNMQEDDSHNFINQNGHSPDPSTPLLSRQGNHAPGNHPLRSAPLSSPRTHMRESTKDIVTAVTHQEVNGCNAVSTVALKDIDVQMNLSSLSGYETYV